MGHLSVYGLKKYLDCNNGSEMTLEPKMTTKHVSSKIAFIHIEKISSLLKM